MGFGGYEPPGLADAVQMNVPNDLVDTVGALIQDPEAFFAALQTTEKALGTAFVEVDRGTWVDPARIAAVIGTSTGNSRVYVTGLDGHFEVEGMPRHVFERIAQKLSEGGRTVGSDQGAAPA